VPYPIDKDIKDLLDLVGPLPHRHCGKEPQAGREATAPSIIRRSKEIQGGKEMPPDGGIVRSHNVHMKPFFSKVRFNASLSVRVLGGQLRSNGLRRGHTDLNGGHPGLGENRGEGVLIIKVFSTSFRPEAVDNEVCKMFKGCMG
jgi:hypothetical protein